MTQLATVECEAKVVIAWIYDYLQSYYGIGHMQVRAAVTFGDLGLTSVELLQMLGALSDWVGYEIEETLVFEYPTIDGLAHALIESKQACF